MLVFLSRLSFQNMILKVSINVTMGEDCYLKIQLNSNKSKWSIASIYAPNIPSTTSIF